MTQPIVLDPIYRSMRYPRDVIETGVRWHVSYRLSHRDLSAMMADQGIAVSHTSVMRWVLRIVPEYERRWARFGRRTGPSWRMDETVVHVAGVQHWLYRAVDREEFSVHSMLSNVHTIEAAQAFFRGAAARSDVSWPKPSIWTGTSPPS